MQEREEKSPVVMGFCQKCKKEIHTNQEHVNMYTVTGTLGIRHTKCPDADKAIGTCSECEKTIYKTDSYRSYSSWRDGKQFIDHESCYRGVEDY
jgi:hypothetical protein